VLSPEREPLHILEGLKRQIGGDAFSAHFFDYRHPQKSALPFVPGPNAGTTATVYTHSS
jgi:hypothetical protein